MEVTTGQGEAEVGSETPKFSAFISYSHRDADVVRKLHSRLESYRLPKGLGRIDALNTKSRALGKVFRDREDLSAAQSLSDAVTDALIRSQVLVVICSPDAKASRWVDQEIAFFKEHCSGRPILAAIVRGEPGDAFPPALIEGGVEPLAADLRKQGDGAKLGFLKVVAGIAGVPLDALVQRESQRQLRRVMAVTGVTALVALAMGAMTIIALQARGEAENQRDAAEYQRAEAEGLIEYMISDLRTDLEGVGRLEIMDGVDQRALKYYRDQDDLADFPADSLLRRGRVIEAMGRNEEQRGNSKQALAHFRELYRTTEELLERAPDDPERVLAHAWSENRMAAFGSATDDPETTKARLLRTIELLESIEGWGADQSEWWKAYSLSFGNRCAIGVTERDFSETVHSYCRKAIASGRRWSSQNGGADPRYAEVFHLFWLSKFEELDGNRADALEAADKAIGLNADLLRSEPENARFKSQRMEILASLLSPDRGHKSQTICRGKTNCINFDVG